MSDTSYNPRRPEPVSDTVKLPKELKGKYVTRAAFAKMQGELKRLGRDMYRMIHLGDKSIYDKYREQFKKQQQFNEALKDAILSNPPKSLTLKQEGK